MYCDYNALEEYAQTLNKNFNNLNSSISDIEATFKNLFSLNNWDSLTRDYILNLYHTLQDNIEIINNQFNNVNQYIDTVINNYKTIDNPSIYGE